MVKKVDWLYHTPSRYFAERIHEITLVQQPLSDNDILEIQEKFLSNGFQYVKCPNIGQGRKILYTFLDSLTIYHHIGCLTIDPQPLRENITDICTELYGGDYLNSFEPYYLEEYFIEYFYCDFMWIEATRALLLSPWFEDVKTKIIDLSLEKQIPILIVAYTEV